jgi:hypothetical protein
MHEIHMKKIHNFMLSSLIIPSECFVFQRDTARQLKREIVNRAENSVEDGWVSKALVSDTKAVKYREMWNSWEVLSDSAVKGILFQLGNEQILLKRVNKDCLHMWVSQLNCGENSITSSSGFWSLGLRERFRNLKRVLRNELCMNFIPESQIAG